jgi:hypothetical protein
MNSRWICKLLITRELTDNYWYSLLSPEILKFNIRFYLKNWAESTTFSFLGSIWKFLIQTLNFKNKRILRLNYFDSILIFRVRIWVHQICQQQQILNYFWRTAIINNNLSPKLYLDLWGNSGAQKALIHIFWKKIIDSKK